MKKRDTPRILLNRGYRNALDDIEVIIQLHRGNSPDEALDAALRYIAEFRKDNDDANRKDGLLQQDQERS